MHNKRKVALAYLTIWLVILPCLLIGSVFVLRNYDNITGNTKYFESIIDSISIKDIHEALIMKHRCKAGDNFQKTNIIDIQNEAKNLEIMHSSLKTFYYDNLNFTDTPSDKECECLNKRIVNISLVRMLKERKRQEELEDWKRKQKEKYEFEERWKKNKNYQKQKKVNQVYQKKLWESYKERYTYKKNGYRKLYFNQQKFDEHEKKFKVLWNEKLKKQLEQEGKI